MIHNLNSKSVLFLLGVFISSVGSSAFIIGLLTFPSLNGVSPFIIGLILASTRIASVVTNFFGGSLGDYFSPKKIVITGELSAVICSFLLFQLSDNLSNDNYLYFLIIAVLKTIFSSIQTSSTQKIGKIFDESLNLEGNFARYLNKAIFGSIFFSMLLNILTLKYGSFKYIIIFDAVTFLINGFLVYISLGDKLIQHNTSSNKGNLNILLMWKDNLRYITNHPKQAKLDIFLSLSMMGANTLNIILLFKEPELIPFASGVFGLAVWLSTFVEKIFKFDFRIYWLFLAASLFAQGLLVDFPQVLLVSSLIRNISYWIIFHNLSTNIMKNAQKDGYAAIATGRSVTINIIGALGEIWVGLKLLPVLFEMTWRSLSSFLGLMYNEKDK